MGRWRRWAGHLLVLPSIQRQGREEIRQQRQRQVRNPSKRLRTGQICLWWGRPHALWLDWWERGNADGWRCLEKRDVLLRGKRRRPYGHWLAIHYRGKRRGYGTRRRRLLVLLCHQRQKDQGQWQQENQWAQIPLWWKRRRPLWMVQWPRYCFRIQCSE